MIELTLLLAQAVFQPEIPKTWANEALAVLEVPLANPRFSPVHIREAEYYQIPARTIYKSYLVYHPSREPAGYMEWLKQQDPTGILQLLILLGRQDFLHLRIGLV